MHTIRQQHKRIAHQQVALQVVHHQLVFSAYATQQLVLEIGVVHHMVGGELVKTAAPQQVSPRVAHMRQRIRLAAQHHCGERG